MHRRRHVAALEELHPAEVSVPRRCRVEHGSRAQGRLSAKDHPIASSGDDRLVQAELREPRADTGDPNADVSRADVRLQSRVVLDGSDLLEHDVQAVRGGVGVPRDEHVASRHVPSLDPWEADRNALPRVGTLDILVVDLHAADTRITAPGLDP